MLESLLSLLTTKPLDVQVWHCDPLLIVMNGDDVAYGQQTKVEFTPFDSTTTIGHGIAMTPDADGVQPEIAICTRQYIDQALDGFCFAKRQGMILMGTDQFDEPVTWFINGAADNFLTTGTADDVEFDDEISAILAEELTSEPQKLNLNSRF